MLLVKQTFFIIEIYFLLAPIDTFICRIFQTLTFGTQQSHSQNMYNSYVHKLRVAARKIQRQNKRAGKILFFHVYSKQ